MGKKKKVQPDYNASIKETSYTRIYSDMLTCETYKDLSIGLRQFYICCRAQASSKIGRQCLYNHAAETGIPYSYEKYFVFPAEHLRKYGYKPSNTVKYFKALEAAGFIEIVEKNQHNHRVNVYAFTSKWKS